MGCKGGSSWTRQPAKKNNEKSAKKPAEPKTPSEPQQPKRHDEAPKQNAKRGRKPYHEQTDLEYTDTDHAFGGEEHIPAFLR